MVEELKGERGGFKGMVLIYVGQMKGRPGREKSGREKQTIRKMKKGHKKGR